jgi:glycosyltransferase involved in cell wall biosynthesis
LNDGAPEVTVVIPTHNRWPRLSTLALPRALAQVGVDHEVIVVDDGSSDQTAARLSEIDDHRLVIRRHDRPLGVARARNTGIEAARGTWVAFLDDDDLWAPHKLRTQLDVARASDASFVYGAVVVVDEDGAVAYEVPAPPPEDLPSLLAVRSSIPGGCSNVVVDAALLRRIGAFDERLSGPEDWDLWLRLARTGCAAASCPDVLVACTAHEDNTYVRTPWREISRTMAYFAAKHRAFGLEFDFARFARWVALERRNRGKRLGPASLLLWISLRYRRPRYGLQGLRVLLGRRGAPPPSTAREPEWLRQHRQTRASLRPSGR